MPRIGDLPLAVPVLAAPMAGGPTTPALAAAAASAGSLAFLAGGYRTVAQLAQQIRDTRTKTGSFGVNLFAPNPVPVDSDDYAEYAGRLAPVAARFGVTLPPRPIEDDDGWVDKLDLLCTDPVPLVSFTFGLPPTGAIRGLHRAGSVVAQTVTSAQEARWAHLRRAGATAVAVGTALLLADEAGTSAVHRRAIAAHRGPTVMTRAFTGRPARGLANEFTARFNAAPAGYPALHHLTSPLRKAAAAAGDSDWVHLWAGTGYRAAAGGSVAEILTRLAG